MNICILSRTTTFHNQSGGMETHLKTLAEGLAQKGHQVKVVSPALEGTDQVNENSVNYIFLKDAPSLDYTTVKNSPWYKKMRQELTLRSKFYRAARDEFFSLHQKTPFDLVISQSSAGIALARDSRLSTPLITIIHGTIFGELNNRIRVAQTFKNRVRLSALDIPRWVGEYLFSHPKLYRRSRQIVAVSNQVKQEFARFYPVYKDKVEVIFNGVDDDIFRPASQKPDKFTILFIGRVAQEKGIDVLLETAQRLAGEVRFIVVGGGQDLEKYKASAQEKGLAVEFIGPQPNTLAPEWYQKAHLSFIPSWRKEGFPMTLAESLCSGLPVLSSGSGGIKDAVTHGENGFISEKNDPEEYASFIQQLMGEPERYKKMAENARKTGTERFSKREMINRYERLFKKI